MKAMKWLCSALMLMLLTAGFALADEPGLIISEVVASNSKLLPLDGEYYDLIELTNTGSQPVQLSDFYLSDSKKEPLLWQLPEVQLAPGKCYVVQATGNESRTEAPFKVSSDGEKLYLNDAQGENIHKLDVPELLPNTSYGWHDGELYYYDEPTIGKANPAGYSGISAAPQVSQDSCLLEQPTEISFSGEGAIYYTLDGSTPTGKSTLYDGTPIQLSQSTVLRFRAKEEGKLWSATQTCTYLFDAAKYELPLLCISGEPGAITGPRGIYTLYDQKHLETAVNLTLIENGQTSFNVDCGLKIHGQGSRTLQKKSFQVRFRGEYGCSELEYKLFEDSDITTFNALVLRCGSEDAHKAFLRDEFLTSLGAETMPEVLYQNHRPVNLFIDGEYFGVYYIRERVTDDFAASHLGGEPEDIDMVKGWSAQEHGENDDFLALLSYCRRNDLSQQEHFDHVASQISLESFMDYYIARAYSGDRDYANIRHVRSRGGDGLWRIVNFDIDWGFGQTPAAFTKMIGKVSDSSELNTVIINALLKNVGFRDQMLTRLAWHLRNTYAPERVLAHLDAMVKEIAHDLVYNYEVWGSTYEEWQKHIQALRDVVQSKDSDRVTTLVLDAQKAFRMTEEEMIHYFGDLYPGK
ncbi:MAG: CotH kinase family protein [Clostridia bacterium]|nr:CotH kinase family protein [Clostridia bacterium]